MHWLKSTLIRYRVLIPLVIFVFLLTASLTFLAGNIGTHDASQIIFEMPFDLTPVAPLPGTPIARFARVNPEIVTYLDYPQTEYGEVALDILGVDIQPVGAYLPRTGNIQFEIIEATPLPTPLPYPTSEPLPLPALPNQILPTIPAVNEDGTPRVLAYTGDTCAPEGRPVDGILTQRFHLYHGGIDLSAALGTPVIATHSGQVVFADWSDVGYGYLVVLQNGPFITYYAHNLSFNVSLNQFVGKGSILAWSGSTGNSSGPHVHYETRINDVPVDPLTFEARGYSSC